MDLISSLRITGNSRLALVGAGGKTTLMFQLAREFPSRVILTTTTHLAQDQLSGADLQIEVSHPSDVPDPDWQPAGDVIIFTGPAVEPNRVKGPDPESLERILALAEAWNCPLLIEADGARKLPIKAPAPHEPPIPGFVDTVITVIGLSGLGRPLSEKWVHRPEAFSELVGIPLDTEIQSTHLVELLVSERGGLKNIPRDVKKILLINQIDTFPNWKTFHDQLDLLLEHYWTVAFGVLEEEMLLEVHQRTAGIVLAGGGSTRFGQPKQLLDWRGKPLVVQAVDTALEAGLAPVLVVTGASHQEVGAALDERVSLVHNPDWEQGQSTSVRAGIRALTADISAAVFLLVDQPLITAELIRALRIKHARSQAPITCPWIEDRAGNPVLFDRQVFGELSALSGDQGGKSLFGKIPPQTMVWKDPASQQDIDSPEDYQALKG